MTYPSHDLIKGFEKKFRKVSFVSNSFNWLKNNIFVLLWQFNICITYFLTLLVLARKRAAVPWFAEFPIKRFSQEVISLFPTNRICLQPFQAKEKWPFFAFLCLPSFLSINKPFPLCLSALLWKGAASMHACTYIVCTHMHSDVLHIYVPNVIIYCLLKYHID